MFSLPFTAFPCVFSLPFTAFRVPQIIAAIVVCCVLSFMYSDPKWVRDHWDAVGKKATPAAATTTTTTVGTAVSFAGPVLKQCLADGVPARFGGQES